MRPTTSAAKQARLALYEQQLQEFLSRKNIEVIPYGASGLPIGGVLALGVPATVQARVDRQRERLARALKEQGS